MDDLLEQYLQRKEMEDAEDGTEDVAASKRTEIFAVCKQVLIRKQSYVELVHTPVKGVEGTRSASRAITRYLAEWEPDSKELNLKV